MVSSPDKNEGEKPGKHDWEAERIPYSKTYLDTDVDPTKIPFCSILVYIGKGTDLKHSNPDGYNYFEVAFDRVVGISQLHLSI